MPRLQNGEFELESGVNPVQPDTQITSNWANTTLDDIALALTQSVWTLDPSFTDPVKFPNGTELLPSMTFTSSPTTGLFLENTGVMGVTVNGSKVGSFDAGGLNADSVTTDGLDADSVTTDALTVNGGAIVNGALNVNNSNVRLSTNSSNATNLYLENSEGTARLIADGGTFSAYDQINTRYWWRGLADGVFAAFYQGATKLSTVNDGINVTGGIRHNGIRTIPAIAAGKFTGGGTSVYGRNISSITAFNNPSLSLYLTLRVNLSFPLNSGNDATVTFNGLGALGAPLVVGEVNAVNSTTVDIDVAYSNYGSAPRPVFSDLSFDVTIFDLNR